MRYQCLQLALVIVGIAVASCKSASTNGICNGPPACDAKYGYRSIDGSCNNLQNPRWGQARTKYARILPNNYGDGKYSWPVLSTGEPLPLARDVSNRLNPPAVVPDRRYTLGLMQFGQIVAHDIAFTGFGPDIGLPAVQCCVQGKPGVDLGSSRCSAMNVPADDPVYVKANITCLPFERTATTRDAGCTSQDEVADPLTVVSGYVDMSIVYGPTNDVAQRIRSFSNGRLTVEERHGQTWPPLAVNVSTTCNSTTRCYGGGDVRMNQNPQLILLQTALMRQHNRIADTLKELNPHWNDEEIYQEARHINIAEYQHIVFTEYVPRIIGQSFSEQKKIIYPGARRCVSDYNPTVDASAIVESSSAALRALHSQISGSLALVDEQREVIGALRLIDNTNSPAPVEEKSTRGQCDLKYDDLARGLSFQPPERTNKYFDPDIKHYLFRNNNKFGIDLRALDIQRERDHGVGTYIEARRFCNLSVPNSFDDMKDYIFPEDVEALRRVYKDIRDVSLNSAGLLEHPAPEALVGPTYQCILGNQFLRTRNGDRFFYENCEDGAFTTRQLTEIRKASIACLLCTTSYCVERMQHRAFDPVGPNNLVTNCSELCPMDLSAWREKPQHTRRRRRNLSKYSV